MNAPAPDAPGWLAFTPRDTVFIRDGRSFDAATDASGETVRPSPTTIAGAAGAAFGGVNPLEVRGPVVAREEGDAWAPYFPVPADLVRAEGTGGRVYRLSPETAEGATDLDDAATGDGHAPLRPLMPPEHAEPVEPAEGDEHGRAIMPGRVLAEYLAGDLVGTHGIDQQRLELQEPLLPEQRVGLARDGRRAREGFLYRTVHLRPKEGWAFLAQYVPSGERPVEASNHIPFGGRGRLADIRPAVMRWPDATQAVGKRVLVYLATPAIWRDGWRMPVPRGATLVAAATYEPEPVATVTPGSGYLETRRLWWTVPAGSVYLLEFADAAAGAAWARKWNGKALHRGDRGDDQDQLRTAGFGVVLTGAWT